MERVSKEKYYFILRRDKYFSFCIIKVFWFSNSASSLLVIVQTGKSIWVKVNHGAAQWPLRGLCSVCTTNQICKWIKEVSDNILRYPFYSVRAIFSQIYLNTAVQENHRHSPWDNRNFSEQQVTEAPMSSCFVTGYFAENSKSFAKYNV